jgi:hypothetical protein
MNKQERIEAKKAVDEAKDYETEQKAIERACTVDMLPTIPEGAIDLFHQFDDRGARRYCFVKSRIAPRKVYDTLTESGFLVAVRPGTLD